MKKKATIVSQPDKTVANKSGPSAHQVQIHKLHLDHSFCDHSHGRVNRFPFGSNNGPFPF